MAIRNSTQTWVVGATVRVGFLSLIMCGFVPTPGDGLPDVYILRNAAGTSYYAFTPHNGLRSIERPEALD